MTSRGVNKVIIENNLYLCGMSIAEVSEGTGIARSTLRFRFKKSGILRARGDGVRLAASRGRLSSKKGSTRTFTEQWKENISKSKLGKGRGISLKPNGYCEITMGINKGRGAHAVAMERHLGRSIRKDEVVHHKNHNRSDNRIENLELMTRAKHASHHAKINLPLRDRDNLGRFI